MDNLTHTLIGVGTGNAGAARGWGRGAVWFMALASNLPDLDAVWSWWAGGDAFLARRMLTHSVVGVPVLAVLAAAGWRAFSRRVPFWALVRLAALAMTLHVFFDLVNSYGVAFLYPFSRTRFELAWIFIIDLVVAGLVASPLLLYAIPAGRRWITRTSVVAMTGLALYVALCGAGRIRSGVLLRGLDPRAETSFSYVFPEALGCHRFRGVVRTENRYRVYVIHWLTGRIEERETVRTAEDHPAVRFVRQTEEAERLAWFFKAPVWRVEERGTGGAIVEVSDLRFRSAVLGFRETPFRFRFEVQNGAVVYRGRV